MSCAYYSPRNSPWLQLGARKAFFHNMVADLAGEMGGAEGLAARGLPVPRVIPARTAVSVVVALTS